MWTIYWLVLKFIIWKDNFITFRTKKALMFKKCKSEELHEGRALAVLNLGDLSAFASRRMTANKTCAGMEVRGTFQYILATWL
jgi:hypothetical protein